MAIDIIWTEEKVRQDLPNVKVKLIMSDKIVKGRVKGKKNRFATVIVKIGKEDRSLHYAWTTIANALNSGKPLIG